MPLLNYTTEVAATRSINEIINLLNAGGAAAVMIENNGAREIEAISFQLDVAPFGRVAYRLPANVPAVILRVNQQIDWETKNPRRGKDRKIPLRFKNNKEQAERIAWRIVKDWLEAQLAINEVGSASLAQVMLAFSVDASGKTLYDRLVDRGSLLLK